MSWGAWTLTIITPLSIAWIAIWADDIFPKWDWKYDEVKTAIEWLKGNPVEEGSIVNIKEILNGVNTDLTFRFIEVIPNRLIRFRVLFPASIIAPENRFEFKALGENQCSFRAYGCIRMPMWLFLKSHPSHEGKLRASRQHIKEEGESLKRMSEAEYALR